jgi:hypothetical protein
MVYQISAGRKIRLFVTVRVRMQFSGVEKIQITVDGLP